MKLPYLYRNRCVAQIFAASATALASQHRVESYQGWRSKIKQSSLSGCTCIVCTTSSNPRLPSASHRCPIQLQSNFEVIAICPSRPVQ